MPDASPDLDSLLAEIDRRLREVQSGLMPERDPRSSASAGRGADAGARLTVGPFASTEAVRGFERALAAMPGVSEVTLTGYEGAARAVFDVQLS
jgi:hypothetical protein